MRGDVGLCHGG